MTAARQTKHDAAMQQLLAADAAIAAAYDRLWPDAAAAAAAGDELGAAAHAAVLARRLGDLVHAAAQAQAGAHATAMRLQTLSAGAWFGLPAEGGQPRIAVAIMYSW